MLIFSGKVLSLNGHSSRCRFTYLCVNEPHVMEQSRYAVPFFFDPHFETCIACLPSCQTADNPAKYPPITYGDYAIWFATRNYEHQNHAATSETIDA
jgi:isopenicillin N synthase-like dioxygenase